MAINGICHSRRRVFHKHILFFVQCKERTACHGFIMAVSYTILQIMNIRTLERHRIQVFLTYYVPFAALLIDMKSSSVK
jgi:hypothetical protein